MAVTKKPRAKAPVIRKSSKGKALRCGSSTVRSVEKRNMVALNRKIMDHMRLKVGDVVSLVANEDGTVTIRKAAKRKRRLLG